MTERGDIIDIQDYTPVSLPTVGVNEIPTLQIELMDVRTLGFFLIGTNVTENLRYAPEDDAIRFHRRPKEPIH